MRSTRTTNAVQRVDMLLVQAERFAQVTSAEEAIARARPLLAGFGARAETRPVGYVR